MRKNTDGKKLRGAVLSAIVTAGLMLLFAVSILCACFAGTEGAAEVVILVITAAVFVAMAVGIFIALVQRKREIKGGEEDEAKKY